MGQSAVISEHHWWHGRKAICKKKRSEFVSYSLSAMGKGNHIEAFYTDFSKALMFKLGKMGLDTRFLN